MLPLQEDGVEANAANQTWRIVFAFCIPLEVLSILMFCTKYRNPSLKDTINYCDTETANNLIKKFYKITNDKQIETIRKIYQSSSAVAENTSNKGSESSK